MILSKIKIIYGLMLWLAAGFVDAKSVTYFVIQDQARPFQIESSGKNHQGIITDIVKEIFSDLGVDLKIKTLPFKRMLVEMHKSKAENWITYGSPAWQGGSETGIQSRFLFNESIMTVKHVMLVKSDKREFFDNVEILKDKTLITLLGFDYPGLDQYFESGLIKQREVKNHAAAIKAVYSDRAYGFVGIDMRINYNLKEERFNRESFKQIDISSLIERYTIHLATSKGFDADLHAEAIKKFAEMKRSGQIEQIINLYAGK